MEAYTVTHPLSDKGDLEKFLEVYDVEFVDLQELNTDVDSLRWDGEDALKTLKASLLRLYIIRKLFLCCLLAVPVVGGHRDFPPWEGAIDIMQRLMTTMSDEARKLHDSILRDDRTSGA